jgi:hypothetical protein
LIGPSGGTITARNGKVVVVFPIGSVGSTVQLTVDSVASPVASPRVIKNTTYSLDAAANVATLVPVTLTIAYDPANLKPGTSESGLKIYRAVADKWERIPGNTVNTASHLVSGLAPGLGTYAILEEAPYAMQLSAGDKQTATVGTAVAVSPAVRVVDTEGFGVSGKIVSFAITAGNGTATALIDTTDNSGIASVGSWTLSSLAGPNAMVATGEGIPGSPISFTATGVAGPPLKLEFADAMPATVHNRSPFPKTTIVRLVDRFGNPSAVAGVSVTATLASGSGTLGGTRIRSTDTAGQVTYDDLVFVGPTGSKTINFSSGDLTALNATLSVTAGTATSIVANEGGSQSGPAGKAVSTAPSVKLTDVDGNPVSGVTVVFSVTSGGGSLTNATVTSDDAGIARVGSWVLGSVAGENRVSATANGLSLPPVVFVATGNPGAAGALGFATKPSATARNRVPFPEQPVIQVQDSLGNGTAQAGLRVAASLVAGGGTLSGDTVAFTDAAGRATFSNLAITGSTGPRTIQFSAPGLPSSSANVVLGGGTPVSMTVNAGNNQTATVGTAVFTTPSVLLRDVDANPVSGVVVTFAPQSGSQVTGGSATTDSTGVARVGSWVLSNTAGTNQLSVTAAELPGTTLTFSATGNPGRAATITLASGNNQTAVAGRGVPATVRFLVADAFGNGAPNETVNFTVSSGGNLASLSTVSLSTGIAVLPAWTLGPSTGVQTVTATVNGLAGQAATVSATAATVRLVTFGDSNTDYGFAGTNPDIRAASYVSDNPIRNSSNAANSPLQLAGKIESLWTTTYSPAIIAINHGVGGTTTGTPRSTHGAPSARTAVEGVTRYDAEVLGWNFAWSGGEPANEYYSGPIARQRAYVPNTNDFVYVSMGTNDGFYLIQPPETLANLTTMIDRWEREGLSASHFIITTLPPNSSGLIPEINRGIRVLAASRGMQLIDIGAFTSNDDGITWKDNTLHVGDFVHYSESVRTWIAQQVVAKMAAVTSPPQ